MSEYERESRRARLTALREAGIDPYPARVGPRQRIAEVRALHGEKDTETLEREQNRIAVVGRVMAFRSFGKLVFLDLFEDGATIQVSARKKELDAETFEQIESADVGDFLRVEGILWRTRTGELTVAAESAQMLAKSLRPLPEKWHGLQDVEARYRQRYLDLLVNDSVRRTAVVRSQVVSSMRRFLDERGFLEVETPVLQPLYGGAAARPFTTHHNTLDQNLFLRISDELYLKRLVIGGLDRVYEIGRNFRNEGISRKHNPEFTMMECYQAYADYHDMMDLAEAMIRSIADAVIGGSTLAFRGRSLDFAGTWPRMSMHDAIREKTGIDIFAAEEPAALAKLAEEKGFDVSGAPSWGKCVDQLFSSAVEPELIEPTFVTDYPTELSPLAKGCANDPRLVERFELFIGGMEIGNAFSELNDPDEQRARFEEQRRAARAGDDEAHPMDDDFLRAVEHGLPPTGGLGIGIDRLVLVLLDAPSLREVILFPHLRSERD